jgi:hypothetical protein
LTVNPYAPPNANLAEVDVETTGTPLWNPDAAACWSLFLTPVFGAYLHMKNWEALDQPRKAMVSQGWLAVSLTLIVTATLATLLAPKQFHSARWTTLVLLIVWYFSSARRQASYVEARFGNAYPRRGWLMPIIAACLMLFVVTIAVTVLASVLKAP